MEPGQADRRGARRIVAALTIAVGCLFVIAAFAKAVHPAMTRNAIWTLGEMVGLAEETPGFAAQILAALAGLEFFTGAWLIIRPWSVAARVAAMGLLAGFCVALGMLLTLSDPPSCGCFGMMKLWESARVEHVFGLGRNLVCIAVLLPVGRSATSTTSTTIL